MRSILVILIGLLAQMTFGQPVAALDNLCLRQFGERSNSLKVKTYAVRIDEAAGGVIALKKDGQLVQGILFFPEGEQGLLMSGDTSTLYLRDPAGHAFGKIKYSADEHLFTGQAMNSLSDKAMPINGYFTRDVPVIPPKCSDDKWWSTYTGQAGEKPVKCILEYLGNRELTGTIYIAGQSYFIFGKMDGNSVDLVATHPQVFSKMFLSGQFNRQGHLTLNVNGGINNVNNITLTAKTSGRQQCFANIDLQRHYSITFPELKIPEFDEVLKSQAIAWIAQTPASQKDKFAPRSLPDIGMSYSYLDIHCKDKRWFSGFKINCEAGKEICHVEPVNFDMKAKQFVDEKDIFTNPGEVYKMLRNKGLAQLKNHPLRHFDDFVQWVSSMDFKTVVLQPDGVLFSSDFHPVYGRYFVLLPFAQAKPYIKNRRLLRHFRKKYR